MDSPFLTWWKGFLFHLFLVWLLIEEGSRALLQAILLGPLHPAQQLVESKMGTEEEFAAVFLSVNAFPLTALDNLLNGSPNASACEMREPRKAAGSKGSCDIPAQDEAGAREASNGI
ncbi:hypothetical protein J437_LFUL004559 [Ladona fulva]|uniref:Uncharacterized protein n=1 Tax=Ladona fulva TaxID=123851 RepID=A0A8K0JYB9_LADFU|nr:hypothetical protein J437_LFUL004559 [Ladona fulva]